jgi:RNA polymerase sigma-70 factor (ECF subfamily)
MNAPREGPAHQPDAADDPVLTALWVAHRRRMLDIAFRILLDLGDAEDVVQEAFSRLARSDIGGLADPEGWLVVVTSRLCLDRLRVRRRRPADSMAAAGEVPDSHAPDPSNQVTLVDNVTMAMHTVLERLSPGQRTSFVLHDVFQYSFEEVGSIVGRTPEACRQLASRARRTLRDESSSGRFTVDSALHRRVSERFIDACTGGDVEGLLQLLDPDVEGGNDVSPEVLVGAGEVAPGLLRYLGPPASPTLLHVPVGDRIGIVVLGNRGVRALVLLTIDAGVVAHVDVLAGEAPRAAVSAALGVSEARPPSR